MKIAILPVLLLALTACATTQQAANVGEPVIQDRAPLDGPCYARNVEGLIGQIATSELGGEILRRTDARLLRWIQPGQAVTMDFRGDRVNVHLDARNRVERITCG